MVKKRKPETHKQELLQRKSKTNMTVSTECKRQHLDEGDADGTKLYK